MVAARDPLRSTRRIAFAFGALASSEIALRVLSVAIFVVVARVLGAGPLGQLVAAQALVALATSLSQGGVTTPAQRRLVRHPEQTPDVVGTTILAQSFVCTCSMVVLIGVTTLLGLPSDDARVAVWFLLPLLFVNAFNLSWVLQAQRRYAVVARVRATAQFVTTVLAVMSAVAFHNLYVVVVCLWAAGALADLYLYRVIRGMTPVHRPRVRAALALLRAGWPFLAIAFMSQVVANYDLLLISATRGDAAAGTYAAAYRVLVVLVGLVGMISVILLPELVKLNSETPTELSHYVSLSLSLTCFASALAASVIITFAGTIVSALYGSTFSESATLLTILGFSIPMSFLNGLLGQILVVLDQERRYLGLFAVTTAIAVLMVTLVVPREGPVGAAVVVVLVELVTLTTFTRAVRRRCHFHIGAAAAFGFIVLAVPPLAALGARSALDGPMSLVVSVICWTLVVVPSSLGFLVSFNRLFGVSFSGILMRKWQ